MISNTLMKRIIYALIVKKVSLNKNRDIYLQMGLIIETLLLGMCSFSSKLKSHFEKHS